MTNPYAPPRAYVQDIADPSSTAAPADRGTRLGAAILDSVIFMLMVYVPVAFAGLVGGSTAAASGDGRPEAMIVGGVVLAIVGFIVWCWLTIMYVRRNGQSIAKKLLSIKVVRTDGSPVSMGRLIWLRNVLNAVISIIPLYGVIDALFIFGDSRQCLHDKLAGTIVVKA
jgi:uncharacterized RDD family membrane protein YckC